MATEQPSNTTLAGVLGFLAIMGGAVLRLFTKRQSDQKKNDADTVGHYIEGDTQVRASWEKICAAQERRIEVSEGEIAQLKSAMMQQAVDQAKRIVEMQQDHQREIQALRVEHASEMNGLRDANNVLRERVTELETRLDA